MNASLNSQSGLDGLKASLVHALCHILGNTCRISRTAKSFEWNAQGRGSIEAIDVFRIQSEELHSAMDGIALHLRCRRHEAVMDYTNEVVAINPPSLGKIPSIAGMASILEQGNEQAVLSVEAGMDVAKSLHDFASTLLLAKRLEAHQQHLYRLALLSQSVR